MKTITINVTAEDIKNGVRDNCGKCPIALAYQRALPGLSPRTVDIGVTYTRTRIGTPWDEADVCILNSEEARKFIVDFDRFRPVKPFSFQVELMDGFLDKLPLKAEDTNAKETEAP